MRGIDCCSDADTELRITGVAHPARRREHDRNAITYARTQQAVVFLQTKDWSGPTDLAPITAVSTRPVGQTLPWEIRASGYAPGGIK